MGIILPILLIIFSYLIGSIPFGVIVGKLRGIDIRNCGSHNIGATNAMRTLGPIWGFIVWFLDMIKASVFVIITLYFFHYQNDFFKIEIHPLVYGMCGALGHLFPIYLKFKGGKGVSSFIGVILVYSWPHAILCLSVFTIVVAITKYVSLGSCLAAISLLISFLIYPYVEIEFILFTIIAATLLISKHIPNIKRLINGTENKINFKKNKSAN